MLKKSLMSIIKTEAALVLKIAVIFIATIAFFRLDLTILFNDALNSETVSYMLAVPFLLTYLIYRKRKMLRAVASIKNGSQSSKMRHMTFIFGALLFVTAILVYWYGSYTFTPMEYHMFTLPIFVASLTLIFLNLQTLRQLIFPIAFLIFLMPPPSEILYNLGTTLSTISANAANAILQSIGVTSTITGENGEYGNPTILLTRPDDTTITFTVDIACSGIYSLIAFLLFATFIAYTIRDRAWKKIALIAIGIPLIYSLNIIRIAIILLIGYYYSHELALQLFHLLGGWILIFSGTILLLAISEKLLKTRIFTATKEKCPNCNAEENPSFCLSCGRILKHPTPQLDRADIAKIGSVALILIVMVSIQTPVFAIAQTQPIVLVSTPSGEQASTSILPNVADYDLSFLYRNEDFEEKSKQDLSLIYLYTSKNQSKEPVWVSIEIASTRSSLHRWETCLITWPLAKGYPPRVNQVELKDIRLNENPPIISRYFAFTYKDINQTQAVLYWYETALFTINSTAQQKYFKISLIAYPEDINSLPQTESQLVALATEISNYWQPIKTWSQLAMLISQNGATLALASTALIIAVAIFYFFEIKTQKKANAIAYQKLSKINQQIIDIVRETEKTTMPTLNAIAKTYLKVTNKEIKIENLAEKLAEIEKTYIIKSSIENREDEPIQTWKTNLPAP